MKKILLALVMALVVPAAFAQNYTAEQVRQRINTTAAKMRSMQCSFVQTKSMKMLKGKVVSHGVMYYEKPGKLRWEYTSPYHYVFILNGQTVWLKDQKGDSKINVAQSKMFKEITRIMMSSVLGTCVSNNKDFNVSLTGKGNTWHAVMKPKQNPMKQMFSTITVTFDMGRSMVSEVKMVEKNGDTTVIELKNVKTNVSLNENLFSNR